MNVIATPLVITFVLYDPPFLVIGSSSSRPDDNAQVQVVKELFGQVRTAENEDFPRRAARLGRDPSFVDPTRRVLV